MQTKRKRTKTAAGLGLGLVLLVGLIFGFLFFQGRAVLAAAAEEGLPVSHRSALDLGWQKLVASFGGLKPYLVVEAGTALPAARDFLKEPASHKAADYRTAPQVDTAVPGLYPVELSLAGKIYKVELAVTDTVPPQAAVQNLTCVNVEVPAPESFLTSLTDATAVTVSYEAEPDLSRLGEQEVRLCLTDAGGNETRLSAILTVVEDTTPPVITGVRNQHFHTGDTVAYKKDVTVTDDYDQEVELKVDSSEVNPTQPGEYTVVYSARDRSGNLTALRAVFTFTDATEFTEEMQQEAAKVLAQITDEGMSQREIAQAIYRWTKSHIGYTSHSDKEDWEKAAVQGFTKGSGDCFVYFATSKALLEAAGIPNIDVEKIEKPGRSRHYWSLVNVGEGWYHFDTTPRKGGGEFFLLTDQELAAYSSAHNDSHDFDPSLYPATPKE